MEGKAIRIRNALIACLASAALAADGSSVVWAANFAAGVSKVKAVPGGQAGSSFSGLGSKSGTGSNIEVPQVSLTGGLGSLNLNLPVVEIGPSPISSAGESIAAAPSPILNKAAEAKRVIGEQMGAPSIKEMIAAPSLVSGSIESVGGMSHSDAKTAGASWMNAILGLRTGGRSAASVAAIDAPHRTPGALLMAFGGKKEQAEPVDPNSNDALHAPGLDDRMIPLIEHVQDRIVEGGELEHLMWTLEKAVSDGWTVRYAYTFNPETSEPNLGFINISEKVLYVNDMLLRTDETLRGAILVALLQEAYDHLVGRAAGTQEARARILLAQDRFLDGADMTALSDKVNIGNAVDVSVFDELNDTRLTVAFGGASIQERYRDAAIVKQLEEVERRNSERYVRQLTELEDQLKLFESGLEREPENAGYRRQVRILREKVAIKRGAVGAAEEKHRLYDDELAAQSEGSVWTPLSVDPRHKARIKTSKLRIVGSKKKPAVDPEIQPIIDLVRRTITTSQDPDINGLGYILETLDELVAAGGRVQFAPPGVGAAAYFQPVTLDLVIGREFAKTHPALVAALMVHELTHAADFFGVARPGEDRRLQRPLTRESERNAFTNEAIFIGAFDPVEIASKLDVRNVMEERAYKLVFHARTKYIEGKTSLDDMISEAYRELFGNHISGLQWAQQVKVEIQGKLAKVIEARSDLSTRVELTRQAITGGDASRQSQLENMEKALGYYEAYVRLYQRQITQFEQEDPVHEQLPEAGLAVRGPGGLQPLTGWNPGG